MCYIDLEPAEVWSETERKARKPHKCSCCHGTIAAGQNYWTHFSVLDGDNTTEKICAACYTDREVFAYVHDGTLCTPGALPEMLQECIAEGDKDGSQWAEMLKRIRAAV